MRAIIDTNILLRLLVADDEEQAARARPLLDEPRLFVSVLAISELCWVLRSRYGYQRADTLAAVEALLARPSVITDRAAAAMGIAFLAAGADFADGVIAATGGDLGGDCLVSFDHRALKAARGLGLDAREP